MLIYATNPFAKGRFYEHFYNMENWTMLASFLLVMGMTLTLLIIGFLLRARKTFNQRLLAAVFGACFFYLLYYYSFLYKSYFLAGISVAFGNGLGFLIGPLLYFYVKSLVVPKKYVAKPLLLHLSPWFINTLLISFPVAINIWFGDPFQTIHDWYAGVADYYIIVENTFMLGYAFFTLRLISRLKKLFKSSYSSLDEKNLEWCHHLIIGLSAIVMIDILYSVYELNFTPLAWNIGNLTAFSFVGLFSYLGYKGMLQSQILIPEFLLKSETTNDSPLIPTEKDEEVKQISQLATFSDSEIETLKKRVVQTFEVDQLYLDENLKLQDLADRVELSSRQLSELLNQHLNITFYDLVNDYRVEAVKEKLHSGEAQNLTLLAIAYDSGFKSKTSFNRVFKAKTNYSPSQYKRQVERQVVVG
ncbi:helix-turn-helix domain-containing protein [Halocola ammonii]